MGFRRSNWAIPSLRRRSLPAVIALAVLALAGGSCSVRRYAVNQVGDALSSGRSAYENDEDIDFVGEALPFGLKLIESLLAESPRHRGMLLTASRGFVLYSYAYVDHDAEIVAEEDIDRARFLRTRARKLYLRAFRYGVRGLELSYPELGAALKADPEAAVRVVDNRKKKRQDLPFLYWTAAALGLSISVSRNDAAMLARIPEVEAMIDRALELDETWDEGALHAFQVQLAGTKTGELDMEAIRRHYARALDLSGGKNASLYLSYAETVSIPNQDRAEFQLLVNKALAVDPEEDPDHRLVTLLAHRRARWLLERIDDLILDKEAFEEEPASAGGGE